MTRPAPSSVLAARGIKPTRVTKRRAEELEVPPAKRPKAPPWLSRQGAPIFREMLKTLEDETPDLVSTRDLPMLGLLAEHLALVQASLRAMKGPGGHIVAFDVDKTHQNQRRKHPAVEVIRQHGQAALSLAREFGMTPSSRVGLKVGAFVEPDEDDGDEDLFAHAR